MMKDIKAAVDVLNKGGVIAFPTETVMGLAVLFDNEEAYKKLNFIKRRPEDKPYTMMVSSPELIKEYAFVNPKYQNIINKFMPGSLTVLLKAKKNVPDYVTHSTGIIGIRIPSNDVALSLLREIYKPILVPSANRSGQHPLKNSDEVIKEFNDELDYVVPGKCENGIPSTIIDLTGDEIKIIREGSITLKMIEEVL